MARLKNRIPLDEARWELARIWFWGSGALFAIVVVQSILGKYEDSLQDVWSWFVPNVLPTLSLMLGVIGASALAEDADKRRVKRPFFGFAKGLSVAYLGVLAATIVLEPFSATPGIKLYTLSNYWLGPLQGLAAAAIGVVFARSESAAPQAEAGSGEDS
jgi:hypothetical protein